VKETSNSQARHYTDMDRWREEKGRGGGGLHSSKRGEGIVSVSVIESACGWVIGTPASPPSSPLFLPPSAPENVCATIHKSSTLSHYICTYKFLITIITVSIIVF
jgi:hypothetical protein